MSTPRSAVTLIESKKPLQPSDTLMRKGNLHQTSRHSWIRNGIRMDWLGMRGVKGAAHRSDQARDLG